ncbi:MAG TPA: alanine-tRNA synthetase second additional domain-containing protein [Clostridia bacterium]|nr:alanine-tRNA synthetase second additional domain-containing protein [Clostridia bacterium]
MDVVVRFVHDHLMQAVYFAPRGRRRLIQLGDNISGRYLNPEDRLIGLVGDAGAGKSLLIRGMFPGLELTNDDEGINIRPLPLLNDAGMDDFSCHTYHLDVRFEAAFTPLWQLSDAVRKAIQAGCRVVVEHFEMLFDHLDINAEVLIGIGEEVIVTRPGIFGPEPREIAQIVFESLPYRRMAHSAEDITSLVLKKMGIGPADAHSDVSHGFMLEFKSCPQVDLGVVEAKVNQTINSNIPISFNDDEHISIGSELFPCTGPRIHVNNAGEIVDFRLLKEIRLDPIQGLFAIVGTVGQDGRKVIKFG